MSGRTYDYSLELTKLGHKVTFFTNSFCHWSHKELLKPDERWRFEFIDGIRVVWLKTIPYSGNGFKRGLNMVSNYYRCLQVSRELSDNPDIVIGPSVPLGTGLAASKIAESKNAKFVFEIRDVWPAALVDDGGLSRWSPVFFIFRAIEKKLYRKANFISSTLPLVFEHVKLSGSCPQKVKWLPNGVCLTRFENLNDYDGGRKRKLTIMYIGGYGQAHDVISIVRAANLLQSEKKYEFKFILIGDGVKKGDCVKEARFLNLRNVEFKNPVKKSRLPQVQLEADILIASVTKSDSYRFGLNLNKIFDYMASARPIIFSGCAPNDPVKESGAGISVSAESPSLLADAILEISKLSPQQRRKMGLKGKKYVKDNFTMKFLGGKMEKYLLGLETEYNHSS